jgi:hypothetical protein
MSVREKPPNPPSNPQAEIRYRDSLHNPRDACQYAYVATVHKERQCMYTWFSTSYYIT